MNYVHVIIFLVGFCSFASCNSDSDHCFTKICQNNWSKSGNINYLFYDNRTFGFKIHPAPLEIYNDQMTATRRFRKFINSQFECVGKWCSNGKFACNRGFDPNCYHVEHIIDRNGGDYRIPTECNPCKDIPANMVMAWSRWNSNIGGGNTIYHYNDTQTEKELIYGLVNTRNAVNGIIECCKNNSWISQNYLPPSIDINRTDQATDETSCDIMDQCDPDGPCECDDADNNVIVQDVDNNLRWVLLVCLVCICICLILVLGTIIMLQRKKLHNIIARDYQLSTI
jgi:hypothetical protein